MVYEGLNTWEKKNIIESTTQQQIIERLQSSSGQIEFAIKKMKRGLQVTYLTREGGKWNAEDKVYIPAEMVEQVIATMNKVWKTE